MTGPESVYFFEYIKCEIFKDPSLLKDHTNLLKFLRGILASENRIANFPKFQKKVDWNFNQCFMQNTNFEFFTNITTQRFTLEGHFRCSHHFVTFCSQRVTISRVTMTIEGCHQFQRVIN